MTRGREVDDMNSMSAHEAQGGHVTYCGKNTQYILSVLIQISSNYLGIMSKIGCEYSLIFIRIPVSSIIWGWCYGSCC